MTEVLIPGEKKVSFVEKSRQAREYLVFIVLRKESLKCT